MTDRGRLRSLRLSTDHCRSQASRGPEGLTRHGGPLSVYLGFISISLRVTPDVSYTQPPRPL